MQFNIPIFSPNLNRLTAPSSGRTYSGCLVFILVTVRQVSQQSEAVVMEHIGILEEKEEEERRKGGGRESSGLNIQVGTLGPILSGVMTLIFSPIT